MHLKTGKRTVLIRHLLQSQGGKDVTYMYMLYSSTISQAYNYYTAIPSFIGKSIPA